MKAPGHLLGQALNLAFFFSPDVIVIKAWQHMLRMHLVEPGRFLGDVCQQLRHLVADIDPAGR